jgi:hypothetical protein
MDYMKLVMVIQTVLIRLVMLALLGSGWILLVLFIILILSMGYHKV